jgi:hypothetical protein
LLHTHKRGFTVSWLLGADGYPLFSPESHGFRRTLARY